MFGNGGGVGRRLSEMVSRGWSIDLDEADFALYLGLWLKAQSGGALKPWAGNIGAVEPAR